MPHKESGHHFSFVDHFCRLCEIEHQNYLRQGKPVCSEAASPTAGVARSALARYDTISRVELEHRARIRNRRGIPKDSEV